MLDPNAFAVILLVFGAAMIMTFIGMILNHVGKKHITLALELILLVIVLIGAAFPAISKYMDEIKNLWAVFQ